MRFPHCLPAWHRVLACLLLAGCALVDQNTFAPAPEAKAQPAAPSAAPARLEQRIPLVSIDFSGPPPDYATMLNYAVRAATTRDRDVQFDVVALVPQASDLVRGQRDAGAVMRSIMVAGVPAARIHLALRADPTLTGRQVQVYVH